MSNDAMREALQWYAYEAEALAKNTATGAHTQAVLASVTVLALDGGRKARAALAQSEAQPVPEPLTLDQVRELVKDCGLDWHRGFMPLFSGDDTNRYYVLVSEVERIVIERMRGKV